MKSKYLWSVTVWAKTQVGNVGGTIEKEYHVAVDEFNGVNKVRELALSRFRSTECGVAGLSAGTGLFWISKLNFIAIVLMEDDDGEEA